MFYITQLSKFFFFFFLSSHHLKPPATTRRDPRLFFQIWTHRGQPPPRRDPRRGSLLRSVTTKATPWSTDHHSVKHGSPRHETQTTMSRSTKHLAVPIPTVWRWWSLPISTVVFGCSDLRWFLVQICGSFWFRSPRQLVIFGAKQQYRKGKNIIFKCGKIIKKYI